MLDADAVINNSSQKVGGSWPRKTHRIYATMPHIDQAQPPRRDLWLGFLGRLSVKADISISVKRSEISCDWHRKRALRRRIRRTPWDESEYPRRWSQEARLQSATVSGIIWLTVFIRLKTHTIYHTHSKTTTEAGCQRGANTYQCWPPLQLMIQNRGPIYKISYDNLTIILR